jgi:hypothetical protein
MPSGNQHEKGKRELAILSLGKGFRPFRIPNLNQVKGGCPNVCPNGVVFLQKIKEKSAYKP